MEGAQSVSQMQDVTKCLQLSNMLSVQDLDNAEELQEIQVTFPPNPSLFFCCTCCYLSLPPLCLCLSLSLSLSLSLFWLAECFPLHFHCAQCMRAEFSAAFCLIGCVVCMGCFPGGVSWVYGANGTGGHRDGAHEVR